MTPYTKQIVELHKIHKAIENCGCNKDEQGGGSDSGNLLTSLIPSNYPKPDLFLINYNSDNDNAIDVTNYNIDDLVNFLDGRQGALNIVCLYESSNLNTPIVDAIEFNINSSGRTKFTLYSILSNDNMDITETSYNNKLYYFYSQSLPL